MALEKVYVCRPRGFCAGVEMAIKALGWMLRVFEPPVYCYHEIVHNRDVVDVFRASGVVFVEDPDDVPPGAPLMLSAHGSSPDVVERAHEQGRVVVDAVCPLVTKVHHVARVRARKGYEVVYVGHAGHDEAVGTMAVAPDAIHLVESPADLDGTGIPEDRPVALLAQTTLAHGEWAGVLAAARGRYPDLWTPGRSDLCFATTNRQAAVTAIAPHVDLLLVIGSENSSNTQALVRGGRDAGGARTHRIDGPADVTPGMTAGVATAAVTAGASAPETLVDAVVAALEPARREDLTVRDEDEYFPLPRDLRELLRALNALHGLALGRLGPDGDTIDAGDRAATAAGVLAALDGAGPVAVQT